MIEDFFDHTCDIYHIRMEEGSPGFNLPASPVFHYEKEPDEACVPCHFAVHASSISTEQTEPANMMDARIKLTLPIGTDIRMNDKIVWLVTGEEYISEFPRNIRDHHLYVYIKKVTRERPL